MQMEIATVKTAPGASNGNKVVSNRGYLCYTVATKMATFCLSPEILGEAQFKLGGGGEACRRVSGMPCPKQPARKAFFCIWLLRPYEIQIHLQLAELGAGRMVSVL